MTEFFQQVVSGLALGSIYAALALALVLIHRATGVINFAQGEMAMFTTYIASALMVSHDFPYWVAFFVTLAIAFVGGVTLQRVVIRPVEQASILTIVIVTIGLVVLLWLFFEFTKIGLAMRAAALNPDASRLVGVRVGWMLGIGWGLAAVLGAVAGMLAAPTVFLEPNMMQGILIFAFASAVLGGIDSPFGAVAGGLMLGVGLNLVGNYVDFVGSDLRLPVALLVILIVLLVRPAGLFGKPVTRRV